MLYIINVDLFIMFNKCIYILYPQKTKDIRCCKRTVAQTICIHVNLPWGGLGDVDQLGDLKCSDN